LGTLLLDLLTEEAEFADATTAQFRFDIPLLADRLIGAIDWAQARPQTSPLSVGMFGASTGAAAALIAAASRPNVVGAVVSRGGRPDLAENSLEAVAAPTLLIVGDRDDVVIGLNQQALARLRGPKELRIVPGATHLFEEPGALDQVSRLAREWFERYLA
jgi:putative phosphoribosyl transferase